MEIKVNYENSTRQRGENWTQEEKDLFLEIMKHSAPIIENKATNTNTNKLKVAEWIKVQQKLEQLHGTKRDILQLKGFWRRQKMAAKKNIAQHKNAINTTGGGHQPTPPTQEDQLIMGLCPKDFIVEINEYDSNAIFEKANKSNTRIIDVNDDLIDIDINEALNECHGSFVEDDIMVTDIQNNEDSIKPKLKNEDIKVLHEEKENITPKSRKRSREQNSYHRAETTHKGAIVNTNNKFKQRCIELMEEEYRLKLKFQRQELCHQELRHKMEIDILTMEKEKKALEIQILRKSLE